MKHFQPINVKVHFISIGFCILLLLPNTYLSAVENIPVWTYYPSPPFITGNQKGFSYDLVNLLNQYSKGLYQFELKLLPRTRLDRLLKENVPGMVLLVNWSWMDDKNQTKYLWSLPLLNDRNEIISRQYGKPPLKIDFNGKESLSNTVFGGISGHQYLGLESAFKTGQIKRRDVREDEQNIELLLHERIDVTTLASIVIHYQIKQKSIQDKIYFSPTPLFSYTRHLLITKKLKYLEDFINQFIMNLEKKPEWQELKKRYAIQ